MQCDPGEARDFHTGVLVILSGFCECRIWALCVCVLRSPRKLSPISLSHDRRHPNKPPLAFLDLTELLMTVCVE